MMKRIAGAALMAFSLAGCESPPPDPTIEAIAAQCRSGDQEACANYVGLQQANASRSPAIGLPQIGAALF